jgi:hypothetical protein
MFSLFCAVDREAAFAGACDQSVPVPTAGRTASAVSDEGKKADICCTSTARPLYPGDLNRSTQHFILEGKDQL